MRFYGIDINSIDHVRQIHLLINGYQYNMTRDKRIDFPKDCHTLLNREMHLCIWLGFLHCIDGESIYACKILYNDNFHYFKGPKKVR